MLLVLMWSVDHSHHDGLATLTFAAAFHSGCAIYFGHSAFCSDDDGEFDYPLLSGRAPFNAVLLCHAEAGFGLYWASSVGTYLLSR